MAEICLIRENGSDHRRWFESCSSWLPYPSRITSPRAHAWRLSVGLRSNDTRRESLNPRPDKSSMTTNPPTEILPQPPRAPSWMLPFLTKSSASHGHWLTLSSEIAIMCSQQRSREAVCLDCSEEVGLRQAGHSRELTGHGREFQAFSQQSMNTPRWSRT